jgi:hypothetical protein
VKYLPALCLMLLSHAANAGWTLERHSFAVSGSQVTLHIEGLSVDTCIPTEHIVRRQGTHLEVRLSRPHTPCGFAITGWARSIELGTLPPGEHHVFVREGDRTMAHLVWQMDAPIVRNPLPASPSEGMWWSSDKPGTGMAFNVDSQGRWFAALYLYDEEGAPTFATLQGESLAYDLDAGPLEPYAVGTSPVILSEGGQCLGCPWSAATAAATDDEAQLLFRDRNHATLKVGDWSLDLTLLPETSATSQTRAGPIVDRHYVLTIDGEAGRHVAVVKGVRGDGAVLTGQELYALACVDCRTVDDAGSGSAEADEALADLVADIDFLYTAGGRWDVRMADQIGRPFVDKTGEIITAITTGDAADDEPTRLELRLLPQGWRN